MKEIGFSMSHVDPPRPRRSTLETFNEEMSVLDRPLEGEVEYYDEAPSRLSAWRRVGMFVGVAVLIGVGGAVVMSRHHAQAAAAAQPAAPASAVVIATAAPAVVPPPALVAEQPAPAAVAPAEAPSAPIAVAEAPAENPAADDEPAPVAPVAHVAHSAWSLINGKSAHAKQARIGSGKTTIRRTTIVKHHVVAKRTARHR